MFLKIEPLLLLNLTYFYAMVLSVFIAANAEELTFDHLIPRRLGGKTTWENIVAACTRCNFKKGGRLPEEVGMAPKLKPFQPSIHQLQAKGRKFPPNYLHTTWADYLYWDVELEK